jgi:hypothetical protein
LATRDRRVKQATAAVRAAKDAGVNHFVWSTLPNVEAISGGKLHVPHSTGNAKIDRIVKEAEFAHHTFVLAPFFYQNLAGRRDCSHHEPRTAGARVPGRQIGVRAEAYGKSHLWRVLGSDPSLH